MVVLGVVLSWEGAVGQSNGGTPSGRLLQTAVGAGGNFVVATWQTTTTDCISTTMILYYYTVVVLFSSGVQIFVGELQQLDIIGLFTY